MLKTVGTYVLVIGSYFGGVECNVDEYCNPRQESCCIAWTLIGVRNGLYMLVNTCTGLGVDSSPRILSKIAFSSKITIWSSVAETVVHKLRAK